jgi:Hemocyanin, ig-like domain
MFIAPEQTSFYDLYKHLMSAQKGESKWTSTLFVGRCQYPKYLLIPKGKKGGMTFSFYFIVSKYLKPAVPFMSNFDMKTSCGVGSGTRFFENRNLLYPIDRRIDAKHFYTPNMHFEDVDIHFNGDDNAVQFF